MLLGVVEASKEVASLVWRDKDVPMRKMKLAVKLIGQPCDTVSGAWLSWHQRQPPQPDHGMDVGSAS
jgi:hypothetical protein